MDSNAFVLCVLEQFRDGVPINTGILLKATHGAQFYDRPRVIDLDAYESKAELNA